ncbi:MAG: hypothetical protein RBG13Loki_3955 [Promethearchaeota archaeon CR_4]|nr:MAG: hypothetical protein RBG13Loki_3955 [Candidatus Lokiarchaeota archaeon CR_4]
MFRIRLHGKIIFILSLFLCSTLYCGLMTFPPNFSADQGNDVYDTSGNGAVPPGNVRTGQIPGGRIITHQEGTSTIFEIVTGDQLSLCLSDSGVVTGIAIDQYSLLHEAREPFLLNIFTSALMTSLGGSVFQVNETTLRQESRCGDLFFRCDYGVYPEYIAIEIGLQTLRATNCSLDVEFSLPIDATGWSWWDGLLAKRTINPKVMVYENVTYPDSYITGPDYAYLLGHGKINNLPFALLSNDICGMAYAIDLGSPVTYFMGYDLAQTSFYSVFSLGLSNLPLKLPGQASMRFLIYRSDPAWGLRSTVDRYYGFFPAYFDNSRCIAGAHAFQGDAASNIPPEVGVKYVQGMYNRFNLSTPYGGLWGCGAWSDGLVDECSGIKSLQYVGYGSAMGFTCAPEQFNQTAAIPKILLNHATSNDTINRDNYRTTMNTWSLPGPWGQANYNFECGWWGSNASDAGLIISVNMDPEIADYTPMDFFFQYSIDPAFRDNALIGISIDGLMADCQGPPLGGSMTDLNASHFCYVDYPLTYLNTTHEPAISLIESCVEGLKYLRTRLQVDYGQDKLISGNVGCAFPQGFFQVPYLDVFMMESWFGAGGWGWGPVNNEPELERLRLMADQKTICGLDYNSDSRGIVEQYMERLLPYAIFPQPGGNWTRDLDLYEKYVPIFQQLQMTGWEPITGARASSTTIPASELILERYGANTHNDLYFVLRDMQDKCAFLNQSSQVQISIPMPAFGLDGNYLIEEQVNSVIIPYTIVQTPGGTMMVCDVTIHDGQSQVFRVFKPDLVSTNLLVDTINPCESNDILLLAQGSYIFPRDASYRPDLGLIRVGFFDGKTRIGEGMFEVINSTHWQSQIVVDPGTVNTLRNLSAVVDPDAQVPEYREDNNIAHLVMQLPLSWHYQKQFIVNTLDHDRQDTFGTLRVNFTELFNELEIGGTLDRDSIRVYSIDLQRIIPCQFLKDFLNASPGGQQTGDVIFLLDEVPSQTSLEYYLLFDTLEHGKKPPAIVASAFTEVSERHVHLSSGRLSIFSPRSGGILKIRDGMTDVCSDLAFHGCAMHGQHGGNHTNQGEVFFWGIALDTGPLAARVVQQQGPNGPYAESGTVFTVYYNGVIGASAYFRYAEAVPFDWITVSGLGFQGEPLDNGDTTPPNIGFYWNATDLVFIANETAPINVSQDAREHWYGAKYSTIHNLGRNTPFTAFVANDPRWTNGTISLGTISNLVPEIKGNFEILSDIAPNQLETYSIYFLAGISTMDEITFASRSLLPMDVHFV